MSALRRSEDLLSLKTRRIVIQNEDSSYPPAGAVLAMDSKGRGGTVITQDVSLNSVALMGDVSAGVLTYSDVSGLLVNSEPIGSSLMNLTVSGASILGTSAVVMGPLTANSVNALVSLTTPNGYITNLDASNATINTLTASLIEAETINVSNATITVLDVSAAKVRHLDASSANITVLDVSAASIHSLDASYANITILDVSAASIHSLDASSANITVLDASSVLINTLTTTTATVSTRFYTKDALIGENTNLSDPSANFVFIQGVSGETVGRIRGSDRSDGTLELAAHNDMSSNIVLNANGFTSMKATLIGDNTKYRTDPSANFVFINAGANETVARVRGCNRSDGTLRLGANNIQTSNIVLNADGSTDINSLDVSAGVITSHGDPITVPTGCITMYGGTNDFIPAGWIICDGSAVSRSTYAKLFTVVGTIYGSGNGTTTFNLPNMQSRFPMGVGVGGGNYLGNLGGNTTKTLGVTEIPAHTHDVASSTTGAGGGHSHTVTGTTNEAGSHSHPFTIKPDWASNSDGDSTNPKWGSGNQNYSAEPYNGNTDVSGSHSHTVSGTAAAVGDHTHTIPASTTTSVGGGTAFSILPPFLVLNFIIKY